MQHTRGVVASEHGRLQALVAKREALKELIREEKKRPSTGGDLLRRLKLENLKLKDEIEEQSRHA
ncbi:MAG: DUF465 domain-containing protein [Rhodospirillales bacterium]|nr:DUF465 domain-containing protein [Rhodospirillales bacterium]